MPVMAAIGLPRKIADKQTIVDRFAHWLFQPVLRWGLRHPLGLPFTISAGVGFVALAGASILEGLILVSSIRDRKAQGVPKREAIEQARLARLRPVLMTGAVAALGFVPMMLATGVGAEVQRPLATVIVVDMACDTFLTMLALPVLYLLLADDRSLEGPHGVRYVRACGDL
jgi:Cu/Ag efflux pump CusA